MNERPPFDDQGIPIPGTEFDYDEVDRRLTVGRVSFESTCSRRCPEAGNIACQMMREILGWVWQDGPKNDNGFIIRQSIVCWVFIPHLSPLTMSQLSAKMLNKDKQSVGRWFTEFRRKFPFIKTTHMHYK